MVIPPMIRPAVVWGHPGRGWPLAPFRTHTDPPDPVSAPSITCSEPSPTVSPMAGLSTVLPPRLVFQAMLQLASAPNTELESDAPG